MDWFLYDNDLRHERVKEFWRSIMREITLLFVTKTNQVARN